jgi:LysR family transcriptional activator of mexEF-oprN operon
MPENYGRDFDLNLLRVFLVVAEAGSVTAAANRLYLTQPAVSAALRRLSTSIGTPLFVRAGRGVELTSRGQKLRATAAPHLHALLQAALSPGPFTPETSERVVRVGLSDANESWLLPALIRALANEAPRLRLIVLPVQFRTVKEALENGQIDFAVSVADELPASIEREALFQSGFTCVFDPRHAKLKKKLSLETYLAHDHVVVSYNGDLRGIIEDLLGYERKVRVSVPTFHGVGSIVEGSALLATLPEMIAQDVLRRHPRLSRTALPFAMASTPMELLFRRSTLDDDAVRFVRGQVVRIARESARSLSRRALTA